ncbi:Oidioi.mRNA.OKI2018_I69.chr2.g4496.t1.cds [Oikopleura dioica]|uniref:Oidioi.mRNA.OKI2018_I69.chr2.g4496.t1.cds n=1 Tax=Oikopleura dioica TaxID=34765 RepID=A0ABN7T445_OIKDI|nr:Oidioi.mRNA.OKI2018_I69.chr2.g4496.t1.cds [Oikopleura dioica]
MQFLKFLSCFVAVSAHFGTMQMRSSGLADREADEDFRDYIGALVAQAAAAKPAPSKRLFPLEAILAKAANKY